MPKLHHQHPAAPSVLSLSSRRRFGLGLVVLAFLWLCIYWAILLP